MIERGGFNLLMNEMIWKIWKSIKSADVTIGPRANLSLSLSLSLSVPPPWWWAAFYDVCVSSLCAKGNMPIRRVFVSRWLQRRSGNFKHFTVYATL